MQKELVRIIFIELSSKKDGDCFEIRFWQLFLPEDTLERILESFAGESVEYSFDPSFESVQVSSVEMTFDPVKIGLRADHDQVTSVGPSPTVKLQREQQCWLRDFCR